MCCESANLSYVDRESRPDDYMKALLSLLLMSRCCPWIRRRDCVRWHNYDLMRTCPTSTLTLYYSDESPQRSYRRSVADSRPMYLKQQPNWVIRSAYLRAATPLSERYGLVLLAFAARRVDISHTGWRVWSKLGLENPGF